MCRSAIPAAGIFGIVRKGVCQRGAGVERFREDGLELGWSGKV
jgi:hypothetical protein